MQTTSDGVLGIEVDGTISIVVKVSVAIRSPERQ
jgi:hypothetical protein